MLLLSLLLILPITLFAMVPTNWNIAEPTYRVSAQAVIWQRTYGTTGREEAGYMIAVSSGGFLMCGNTDPGTGTNRDAWLLRVDANGNQLWNQSYPRDAPEWLKDVVECSDGGFAATGTAPDILGINDDVLVLRTDANGNQLWNSTFGGPNPEVGWAIIEVSGGGFAVISYTDQNSAGLEDMWLIRLDANGNHLWNHTYGGAADDAGFDLTETSGGFALFGRTESFGAGGSDMWLVHVDASGNHLWNQTYGGTDDEWGLGFRELANGDFGLCGDTLSFGPNAGGAENAWFLRVTSTGTHLWNHTYGGTDIDWAIDFDELSDGSFVLCGSTRSFGVGAYDYYIMRTDANGILQWNETYGGNDADECYAVLALSSGGFIVYGHSVSSGPGLEDFWLLHISDGPTITPPPPLPWLLIIAPIIIIVIIIIVILLLRRRGGEK